MKKRTGKIGISIGVFLLALFGTVGVVFGDIVSRDTDDIAEKPPNLVLEEGKAWDGSMPTVGEVSEQTAEFTEIPGYAKITITETMQELDLINPKGNTVYFVYTLSEYGEVLRQTGAIEPDKYVSVNLYELLSKGTHHLKISIECYDLVTQAICNGAVQEVEVFVR